MSASVPPHRHRHALLALAGVLLACACSGDTTGPGTLKPSALAIAAGDNQTGSINAALPTALSVKVTAAGDAPVAGTTVQFSVTQGVAAVSPVSTQTDATGTATTTLTLGATAGAVIVSAAVTGTALTAQFRATTIPPDADSTSAPAVYNPDWTEATHGKVAPNYAVIFPQDAVSTIEITLTAAQWTSVRANMTTLYGFDFGTRPGLSGSFPEDDPDYVAVPVRYNGKLWKNAGWRLKGNSTLASAWGTGNYKLPFRIKLSEFEDSYPAIKGQRLYGFEDISFSPGRTDPSLIHEKSAADIFRAAGVPAARTAFYRVYIDFGAGRRYCGLYTAVEVIDDTMIKDQFGEDKGNIYKPESAFRGFVEAEFEKKNNKAPPDFSDVQAAIAAVNSPLRLSNAAQWRAGLEAVFNVDHFLKWLAVSNAIVNWDSYGSMPHNYYLYNHSTRRLLWIPWDHNEALSGSPAATGGPGPGTRGLSLAMNEVSQGWPLIRFLADDPVYLAQYRAHLKAFRDTVFTQAAMDAMFDRYTELITPHVVGATGEEGGATYLVSPTQFTNAVGALKTHVATRRALIATYVP